MTELSTVATLTTLIQTFIATLRAETACIREHRLPEISSFLIEKQGLWQQQQKLYVDLHTEEWDEVDDLDKQALLQSLEELQVALEENNHALNLAYQTQQYLVNIMVDAVKKRQAPVCSYTREKRHDSNLAPVSISHLNLAL